MMGILNLILDILQLVFGNKKKSCWISDVQSSISGYIYSWFSNILTFAYFGIS